MVLNLILLAGLWWVLTKGSAASWLIGVPALVSAAWANRQLRGSSSPRISLIGLTLFVPFFIWQSLRGGIDVAWRTVIPRMRIQPGFSQFRTGLTTPSAQTFFTNCINLLPGTLAADLQNEWIEVHVLNSRLNTDSELIRLERAVARLFGESADIR